MYFGAIKNNDIANGTGVRVSLFVSGCRNHCEGCFQPETWSFKYGKEFTKETEDSIIEMLRPGHIQGLTILGGDPFEPENQKVLLPFLNRVREEFKDSRDIWMYSGYTFEELTGKNPHCSAKDTLDILKNIDVLVDGRFVKELKNLSLAFRGSSNQRILDVQESLRLSEATEYDLNKRIDL